MLTLLAVWLEFEGIESIHVSVCMRRATSSRNELTSSPVNAANETFKIKYLILLLNFYVRQPKKSQ